MMMRNRPVSGGNGRRLGWRVCMMNAVIINRHINECEAGEPRWERGNSSASA